MDVSLVMFKSDGTRREFPITKERTVVGRKPTCDLRIPLSSVSRQHCEIRVTDSEVKVRDLGSSNGTYHNNSRVQEAKLEPGDEIVIGPVVFTVVIDGQPEQIEPVRTMVESGGNGSAPSDKGDTPQQPQQLAPADDEMPRDVEEEIHSPTVDLDDPIAALERLAEMEDQGGEADDDEPIPLEGEEEELRIVDDEDERS